MPQLSTQAAIVAAAAQVVGEQGYTAARVSDIAARAAVSSGSLYRHFGDRGRLLAAGLAKLLDDSVVGWAAPAETAPLSVSAAVWAGVEPRGAGAAKAWAHAACLAPHFPVAAAAYASATARWEERIVAALSGQGLERRRAVAGARRLVSVGDGLRQRLVAVPADRDVCLDALAIAVGFELGPNAPAAGSGRGADAARAPGPGSAAREGHGHGGRAPRPAHGPARDLHRPTARSPPR
ncbi:MAG: TetR/AcrR family transcriptional regulator [Arthrobacter sp.]|jgi:AcrR family transcriptional regulator|nr:TetR/AcrR family transcriptional regulator [Arthrobacter sp.]